MPRPQRCRRICQQPPFDSFFPQGGGRGEPIVLTLDEYETLRLIDLEEKSHEQCALQMDIARSTVQEIYESARRKVSACLVHGKRLRIAGGNCRICNGREQGRCGCCQHIPLSLNKKQKGDTLMKIAIPYENGQVFQHFGHTEQFKLYTVEDGKLTASEVVSTNGSGHGALAGFLMSHGVDTLLCGGIGSGAQAALAQMGIRLYGGVTGEADEALRSFLEGRLRCDPEVRCAHHAHHSDEHACGEHGCGQHGCH